MFSADSWVDGSKASYTPHLLTTDEKIICGCHQLDFLILQATVMCMQGSC